MTTQEKIIWSYREESLVATALRDLLQQGFKGNAIKKMEAAMLVLPVKRRKRATSSAMYRLYNFFVDKWPFVKEALTGDTKGQGAPKVETPVKVAPAKTPAPQKTVRSLSAKTAVANQQTSAELLALNGKEQLRIDGLFAKLLAKELCQSLTPILLQHELKIQESINNALKLSEARMLKALEDHAKRVEDFWAPSTQPKALVPDETNFWPKPRIFILGLTDAQQAAVRTALEYGYDFTMVKELKATALPSPQTTNRVIITRWCSHSDSNKVIAHFGKEKCTVLHTGTISAVIRLIESVPC